jgi:hypothetical protein
MTKDNVEPVAWRAWFDADNGARWLFTLWPEEERLDVKWEPLYTTPPEQQAPVQERCKYCDGTGDVHDQTGEWRGTCHCGKAAQRQWVGLTDDEIDKYLNEDAQGDCEMHEYARAIEAKLKQKNGL